MNRFKKGVKKQKDKERFVVPYSNGDTPIMIDICNELEKCIDEVLEINKETNNEDDNS